MISSITEQLFIATGALVADDPTFVHGPIGRCPFVSLRSELVRQSPAARLGPGAYVEISRAQFLHLLKQAGDMRV